MQKIEIPIDKVDVNLYQDLLDTGLAKVKNKNTDRETLVFMVFNPRIDTSKIMHNNIVEHPNQLKLIETDAL